MTFSASFKVINLRIVFVREVVRSDGSKTVFYRITGESQNPVVDVQSTISTIHGNLQTNPIKGVTVVESSGGKLIQF